MNMIRVESNQRSRKEWFKSYDDLFNHLTRHEHLSMAANPNPNFTTMNWRFTVYAGERVDLYFSHLKGTSIAIKEACDKQFALIEICTGDFTRPKYVVVTLELDMLPLKKKWVLDYCEAHNMVITET